MQRREFVQIAGKGLIASSLMSLSAAHLSAQSAAQNEPVTARQIIDRIKRKAAQRGVKWNAVRTVDTIKAGNPDTVVKGIATSFMSMFDVLQRAAASGKNLIVTHEPTFWNHLDNTEDLADDPIFQQKMDFIRKNNMVIWRFHDHIHPLNPDPIYDSFQRKIGWDRYVVGDSKSSYEIPETTLIAIARDFQSKLGTDSIRFIGDPEMKVRKVGHGIHNIAKTMDVLPNVDVIIIPEGREWDSIEYVRDMVDLGLQKGLILLSHEVFEEWGMGECANWLREFIPEVPIEWISSGDPFWTPVLKNQL